MSMLTDYNFWFAQPSSLLNKYDWALGYMFGGMVALSIILWLVKKFFVTHPVVQHLIQRTVNSLFWMGLIGAVWFGFRYQIIPILSKRVVAGGIILIWLIWVGFIKYYFWFRFFKDKQEYDYTQVKNKYITQKKK